MVNPFIDEIAEVISNAAGVDKGEVQRAIEVPPDGKMGDYAFPCFVLAKEFKKNPTEIADELSEKVKGIRYVTQIKSAGPYLNFFVDKTELNRYVLNRILNEAEDYGRSDEGLGKTVVIDYSSPNIAKPFHIAHLRSTAIGNSIKKIYEFLGYNCIGVNHLGDWGTNFTQIIAAYKRWGDKAKVEEETMAELFKLYVKFQEEAKKDDSLGKEANEWSQRLEQGDNEAVELWRWFRDESLKEFKRIYQALDVDFDSYAGESFYVEMIDEAVQKALDAGLATESEGALIVDLSEYNMPPLILRKSDGTSIYHSRDLAAALYRFKEYNFDKLIYTTAVAQSLHFRQLFKALELMGMDWVERCVHVPFGIMSFKEGKISTRRGNVVFLEDVLNGAVELTGEIIEEKNPDLEDKDSVAKDVGIGAVIFADLSSRRTKNVVFDWDRALNFDGETGPYMQYTYARLCSVLRKYGKEMEKEVEAGLLTHETEADLIKLLERFPQTVMAAAEAYEPSIVAGHLTDVATAANKFYNSCRVLGDDAKLTKARIALVYSAKVVIGSALGLLGMKKPERM